MKAAAVASVFLVLLGACDRAKPAPSVSTDSLAPVAVGDTGHPVAPVETVFVSQVPPPAPRRTPRPAVPPPVAPAPPAPAAAMPAQPAPEPAPRILDAGTDIRLTLIDSIHSHYNRVGDMIRATVDRDALDDGRVVIPAGAVVSFSINAIAQAGSRGHKGTLDLAAQSVQIRNRTYPVQGTGTDYDFEMKARSVNAGDVATAAGGAAVGAILGHVICGKAGTVIGAIGGGAAGTAVAAKNVDRDIVVHAGAPLTLTLLEPFQRP